LFFTRTHPTLSLSQGDLTEASSAVFMKYSFQEIRLVIFKEVGKTLNMIQTTLPTFFGPVLEEVCQPCVEFTKKNGKSYCFCNRRASYCTNTICKEYGLKHGIKVGGEVCEHNRVRITCKECGGSQICEHNKERKGCQICDPVGHTIGLRRRRRYRATQGINPKGTLKDLYMTGEEWVKYLHKTFEDNYGRGKTDDDEVQIDEIIPCSAWNLPVDNKYCWHYLNSQWLLGNENQEKGTSYTEEDKLVMIERIDDYFRSASAV